MDIPKKPKFTMPKTVQILTNLNCNLNCTYCYENKIGRVNDINFIKPFIKSEFDKLENPEFGVNLELIGGESLLYPDLLTEITEFTLSIAREKKIPLRFGITTNGTLLDLPKVREFIEKYGKYYEVGISIDGPKEIHDKYRKYLADGKGTYDDAIKNLPWLFKYCRSLGVKATFSNETILELSTAVLHLIKLGFTTIGSNPAYEYPISLKDGMNVALELVKIVDYLFENHLEKKINFFQLGEHKDNKQFLMRLLSAEIIDKNYCGSGEHMTCLGFDNQIYGCNRFCTMNKPNKTKDNIELYKEVKLQYTTWPEECKNCNLMFMCPSCAAACYEEDKTPAEYFGEKRMCGWTYALAFAKLYFQKRVEERELLENTPQVNNLPKS